MTSPTTLPRWRSSRLTSAVILRDVSDIDVGALRYFRATSGRIDGVAVDMARIEAGLLLIEVDFFSSKKALHPAQQYSPFEMGLGRLVSVA